MALDVRIWESCIMCEEERFARQAGRPTPPSPFPPLLMRRQRMRRNVLSRWGGWISSERAACREWKTFLSLPFPALSSEESDRKEMKRSFSSKSMVGSYPFPFPFPSLPVSRFISFLVLFLFSAHSSEESDEKGSKEIQALLFQVNGRH